MGEQHLFSNGEATILIRTNAINSIGGLVTINSNFPKIPNGDSARFGYILNS